MEALHAAPVGSPLFDRVLPHGPVVRELLGRGCLDCMVPEEARVVASAGEARRREFAAGRACARAALTGLGAETGPILRGPRRDPLWPASTLGSITHCAGLAAAAVASTEEWWALGIDAEPAEHLPARVAAHVMGAAERSALAGLPDSKAPWDRVVFSAKESLYKAWFPLRREWLGFDDAVIRPRVDGSFSAHLRVPEIGCVPREVYGRWTVHDGFVATAIAIPRPASAGTDRWTGGSGRSRSAQHPRD